jgi:ABC-type molybdate transport system substrate-binding protein
VNVIATYPIAAVAGPDSSVEASRFVSYVTGPEGQKVLDAFGFLPAPG